MTAFTLEDLGFTASMSKYCKEQQLENFLVARVIQEHKERYVVRNEQSELEAELVGNLRFTAESRLDLPAVGDWVAISEYDKDKALIHAVLPRYSCIERQAVGKQGQKQIIAANVDVGLILMSVNRDFNMNRLERYMAICHASKISPVLVLSKVDLISTDELEKLQRQIGQRLLDLPQIALSAVNKRGFDEITDLLIKGKTYCLLGSSGVGKSTLLNMLIGQEWMQTTSISEKIDRGKHKTTHRELVMLESGGMLIDNPGMREVGMTDSITGLEQTFDRIFELAQNCRFKDCRHVNEAGCAVLEALEAGEINPAFHENFIRMEKERVHFESSAQERKQKDKNLGKLIKNYKKQKNNRM
jgi:ribosome biogenesis GTPase